MTSFRLRSFRRSTSWRPRSSASGSPSSGARSQAWWSRRWASSSTSASPIRTSSWTPRTGATPKATPSTASPLLASTSRATSLTPIGAWATATARKGGPDSRDAVIVFRSFHSSHMYTSRERTEGAREAPSHRHARTFRFRIRIATLILPSSHEPRHFGDWDGRTLHTAQFSHDSQTSDLRDVMTLPSCVRDLYLIKVVPLWFCVFERSKTSSHICVCGFFIFFCGITDLRRRRRDLYRVLIFSHSISNVDSCTWSWTRNASRHPRHVRPQLTQCSSHRCHRAWPPQAGVSSQPSQYSQRSQHLAPQAAP